MAKTRRSFVKKLLAGTALLGLPSSRILGKRQEILMPRGYEPRQYGPNDTIRVAAIGMGIMGFNNCQTAIKVPGVELVAVCDLYQGRLDRSKEVFGDHLMTTRNYQEILDRKDIDAVIVSTTDHWHDTITIAAMESGKGVYCEKPMVHQLSEGAAVVAAQKRTGQVLQIGSQRVSSILIEKVGQLYREGAIGELVMIEAVNDRQSANGAWQYSIPTDANEQTINWEGFLGDAPQHSFDPVHFFRWRNYQAYGTGVAGDLFVHLFSGIHTIIKSNGPNRIFATGGLRYWKDGRDVPDLLLACCDYPEAKNHPAFNLQLRVNFIDGGGGGSRTLLVGTEGVIELGWSGAKVIKSKMPKAPGYGGWDSYETFSSKQQAEFKKWYKATYPGSKPRVQEPTEMTYTTPDGYSAHYDHHYNFFEAVRTKGTVVEDAAFGFRAAAPSLAANKSYFEQKVIHWDPEAMELG